MKKMTANEIRRMWLDFFASKGHYIEPSASLVPHNDPTLLWINSGVAALKKYFDGTVKPDHLRITNSQKAIRTNDIENVGHTSRHHTFFEMLGNFSIGDYFRNEVIEWAAELLMSPTYYDLPKEKLFITYHPDDLQTKGLWMKAGIDESHLIPLEGNFWEIGAGPSGPDTEIFFDRGAKYDPQNIGIEMIEKDLENDRYIEIWNIVFSQYNAIPGIPRSEYKELPSKNIDTGCGLERLVSVIQGTDTNFETDLFSPTLEEISKNTTVTYQENPLAYKVIADHARSLVFALSDQAAFSSEGRGYVLRRLLRRASRYARTLGINEPFIYKLVNVVCETMGDYYPYLYKEADRVSKSIKNEETKFAKTLISGEALLHEMLEKSGSELSGADAFKLSDTFGFPLELTEEIANEAHKTVNHAEYDELLKKQKEMARAARGTMDSFNKQAQDLMEFTDKSVFLYDFELPFEAQVIGTFKDGVKVDVIEESGEIILDRTIFFAESGGQEADLGTLQNDETLLSLTDCQKAPNSQHLHFVNVNYGTVKVGDRLSLILDEKRRQKMRQNHSVAHLLQKALQETLGHNVHQAGSLVSETKVRFDFTYDEKISDDNLRVIERKVNEAIDASYPIKTVLLNKEEALKTGAMALFSEKYGEIVRVVSMGDYSSELCAGTHAKNTNEIQCFVIESESSIASGVRRIEGLTGFAAYEELKRREELLKKSEILVKAKTYEEVNDRIKSLLEEITNLKKDKGELTIDFLNNLTLKVKSQIEPINDKSLLVMIISNLSHENFLTLGSNLQNEENNLLCLLINKTSGDKSALLLIVGRNLIAKGLKAGALLNMVSPLLQAKGGGRPDLAQGNCLNLDKIHEVREMLKEELLKL